MCIRDRFTGDRLPGASDDLSISYSAADRALLLNQLIDGFLDRALAEQVPGSDRIGLSYAVAAVLSLVVGGRGPVKLKEEDVGGGGEREADAGGSYRADDHLSFRVVLKGVYRGLAAFCRVATGYPAAAI